ncbi:ENTH domain-containing protein [Caerostris extrusa]|uniref:ENTH domain-containing protein n=1 Tax=Caerostris extrusa TaxID=172846 RepID=A0AAV4NVA1_CAEEX|nr:ENTH domain-containing protein [Caerostris extrusa]
MKSQDMNSSPNYKKRKSSMERNKIRRWILMAVSNIKGNIGATIFHIRKFLDSKQNGISNKPEMKLMLKRLLESGYLVKNEGKYKVKNLKKKSTGKEKQKVKSDSKRNKESI